MGRGAQRGLSIAERTPTLHPPGVPFFTTLNRRLAALAVAVLVVAGWLWWRCEHNPDVFFLTRHAGAEWIVYPAPPDPSLHRAADWSCTFRRSFVLAQTPPQATLTHRAFRNLSILLNGQRVVPPTRASANWKLATMTEVGSLLQAGTNELIVTVINPRGPPALWLELRAGDFHLATDEQWAATLAGATPRSASHAGARREIQAGTPLYSGATMRSSFAATWPWLFGFTGVAALVWLLVERSQRALPGAPSGSRWTSSTWIVPGAALVWAALILNNAALLPVDTLGYDAPEHLNYIRFIQQHGRVPFASDGFQMFQPPLFYLLGAGLLSVFHLEATSPAGLLWLRALTLGFGLLHAGCVFVAARLLFPENRSARVLAAVGGALLPMLLYLSFYLTNEAPMAALVALALVICLRMLKANQFTFGWSLALGICLGAALLTKVSALAVLPIIALALAGRFAAQRQRPAVWLRSLGVVALAVLVVSGWYYFQVWQRFGTPLVLSWDHFDGRPWWQETGFRTREFFLHGGQGLTQPWFSGNNSFWDGLYTTLWGDGLWSGVSSLDFRTPWNYDLAGINFLLALVPTGLMVFGAVTLAWRWLRTPDAGHFLLLGTAGVFLAAIAFICLKAPYTASVKAFYGLSALIPLAVFAATGWTRLHQRHRGAGAAAAVLLLLTALTGVASLWIRRGTPATESFLALHDNSADRTTRAGQRLAAAAEKFSEDTRLALLYSQFLSDAGRPDEARSWAEHALKLAPDDARCLGQLAMAQRSAGDDAPAILLLRRALAVNPLSTKIHQELALALAATGQAADALAVARAGLATAPANRLLHRITGAVCLELNQPDEAAQHLQWALDFGEDKVVTRLLLASARLQLQQPGQAVTQLTEILRQQPDHAEALALLAAAESARGQFAAAVTHLTAAVKLAPQSAAWWNNLAWLRATCRVADLRDGAEAVRCAREACRLTEEKEPQYLGTLAAAYAEDGKFAEAVATCRRAIALAEAVTNQPVASRNRELLQLYLEGKPYREVAPAARPQ